MTDYYYTHRCEPLKRVRVSDYYYVGGFYGNASVQVPDGNTGLPLHYPRARSRCVHADRRACNNAQAMQLELVEAGP